MTMNSVGDYRITKLADCEIWRVERLSSPRLFWRVFGFRAPSWRVVYRYSMMLDEIPAEYLSFRRAQEAVAVFQSSDDECAARSRRLWTPVR